MEIFEKDLFSSGHRSFSVPSASVSQEVADTLGNHSSEINFWVVVLFTTLLKTLLMPFVKGVAVNPTTKASS